MRRKAQISGHVPCGSILVDGLGVGDVEYRSPGQTASGGGWDPDRGFQHWSASAISSFRTGYRVPRLCCMCVNQKDSMEEAPHAVEDAITDCKWIGMFLTGERSRM